MYNLGRAGLTYWSPTINVARDPRFLLACKHAAAYDVDNWLGVDRYHFDARVTEQDMVETFLRPFEMLLKQTIRGDWDLHGYIVADCDSIEVMVDYHKWLGDTKEDAVAQTLKAGLDLDCCYNYTTFTRPTAKQGKVREEDIDKSLNPSKFRNLAVVGPHANATAAMTGKYAGIPFQITAPIDGLAKYAKVMYEMGCGEVLCKNESFIFSAMKAAKNADTIVILAGLDLSVEQESLDREDLLLPGYQTQLINQVVGVSRGPVILVIMSAGGIDISFAKENENIKAILWAGYPREEGGQAIADVVFGKYNPGIPCRYSSPVEGFMIFAKVKYDMGCSEVACKNDSLIIPAMEAAKDADATIILLGLDLKFEAEFGKGGPTSSRLPKQVANACWWC
ncbi:Beta-D-xylosidase [Quillaja saponaria]|uniref:Beta-D-xylosidase n=1 Tax=Quillaja saponaria TaxID=32244 RepID=A0AAD7M3C1_QUISA|nr:Beta-D-xylosidase [Quillaja saponaria]